MTGLVMTSAGVADLSFQAINRHLRSGALVCPLSQTRAPSADKGSVRQMPGDIPEYILGRTR